MRFTRNAKIFRGQLDPAPVAGVFFLLVIFVLLGTLLYTPGVLIQVGNDPTVTLTRNGSILFEGKHYTNLLDLRQELSATQTGLPVRLKTEAGAPAQVAEQIRNLLVIEPPIGGGMVGTTNPIALVAVNLRGQFFFENQLLTESELSEQLRERRQATKNLTLVLLADKSVNDATIVRLASLAGEVGIREVLLSTRPGTFSMQTNR